MAETAVTNEQEAVPATPANETGGAAKPVATRESAASGDQQKRKRTERRRHPRGRTRDRVRSEFDQKIISIRRVARVVQGGRRFSFSVAMVVGDRKGSVGVGTGKASDTSLAIDKAARDAKKRMVKVPLSKDRRIAHDTSAKYSASHVWLAPAAGRGLVAGGAVRVVLELAGVGDVTAKILSRSKNHLNNARATLKALENLKSKNQEGTIKVTNQNAKTDGD